MVREVPIKQISSAILRLIEDLANFFNVAECDSSGCHSSKKTIVTRQIREKQLIASLIVV